MERNPFTAEQFSSLKQTGHVLLSIDLSESYSQVQTTFLIESGGYGCFRVLKASLIRQIQPATWRTYKLFCLIYHVPKWHAVLLEGKVSDRQNERICVSGQILGQLLLCSFRLLHSIFLTKKKISASHICWVWWINWRMYKNNIDMKFTRVLFHNKNGIL